MNRERVVVFLDFANINRASHDNGIDLDFSHFLDYLIGGRFLVDAHAYVPIDPRNEHGIDRLISRLWGDGYVVHDKIGVIAGDTYKCDFDVEITMDVLNTIYQIRPDTIVLASGDGDFTPLVQEARRLGVRVETASFESSASRDLRLKSSGFISLDVYISEFFNEMEDESPGEMDVGTDPLSEHVIQEQEEDIEQGEEASQRRSRRPNIPSADDY